jgi:hypothetical protein
VILEITNEKIEAIRMFREYILVITALSRLVKSCVGLAPLHFIHNASD